MSNPITHWAVKRAIHNISVWAKSDPVRKSRNQKYKIEQARNLLYRLEKLHLSIAPHEILKWEKEKIR